MLKFLLRVIGYLLVAASFVLLILDGARAIANRGLSPTSLHDLAGAVAAARLSEFRGFLVRTLPPAAAEAIWTSLAVPAAAAGLAIGFLLLWLGRRREPGIGTLTGR